MAKASERSALVKLAHWLANQPAIYEIIQSAAGRSRVAAWLRPSIGDVPEGLVLDVGSSGGEHSLHYARSAVLLDIDLSPLIAAKRQRPACRVVCGSALALPIRTGRVSDVLFIAVSHHLDDRSLEQSLFELARVASKRVIFMDAVRSLSPISKLLWVLDRGAYPRSAEVLSSAIAASLQIDGSESLRVLHLYRLWIARPRVRS